MRFNIEQFQSEVWGYYHEHGRGNLPWRQSGPDGTFDPYKIMVSEIMLQQTQVGRVVPKYLLFIERFPDVAVLAEAPLGEVLRSWSGLGYNRRAQFLHQAARQITTHYNGVFPRAESELAKLRGIGRNTAGAILAYSFNQPVVFIETNIRTVFIHHFFADEVDIPDKSILPLIESALDREHPREWYWALMDYGSYLKQTAGNINHRSRHYAKQPAFAGSRRQIRGRVISLLTEGTRTADSLQAEIQDERLSSVLDDLVHEGLVGRRGSRFIL
jgi:A/G-specific adenine glycosylase